MTTPSDLISRRVITGRSEERLADVAQRLTKTGATHHCVVLDETSRKFVGLVQLTDLLGRSAAGNRILGDLISPVEPVRVRPHDTVAHVATLFERHELAEAVLLDADDCYLGLITAQSVLEWSRQEYRRSEKDLAEALERSRQASQAKDHFIAAVSHELRTPLTPVLLVASAAATDSTLSPDVRSQFAMIAEHVAQEAKLVEALIEQGSLLSGDLALPREVLSVHPLLQEVVEQARPALASKEIVFALELAAPEPRVEGDRTRLLHVFSELLANAIRFTPAGGQVRLRTAASTSGAYLEIRFSDTGVGFSAADMARVFEAFAEPARRDGEMGLSLSIARGLVEMHSGQLRAESAGRDQGATFVVRLPLLSVPSTDGPTTATKPERLPTLLPGRPESPPTSFDPNQSTQLAS